MKIIIRKIACQGEHDQRDDFSVSDAGGSEERVRSTVMIPFSAQGAYLLLVAQGRALIQDRALIRDKALISFLRKNPMFNLFKKEQ